MTSPADPKREAYGKTNRGGETTFGWSLTSTALQDAVRLVVPLKGVLPIIFVPGIMGSNLKAKVEGGRGQPVWRLDKGLGGKPISVVTQWISKSAGIRQSVLHPKRVEVDSGGALPKRLVGDIEHFEQYRERGWGEVGQASYEEFLVWLEEKLNSEQAMAAAVYWKDFKIPGAVGAAPTGPVQEGYKAPELPSGISMEMPCLPGGAEKGGVIPITTDDLLRRSKFRMPVYAFGYNWLESNEIAAKELQERIDSVIAENNAGSAVCKQVVLVTHSMGGLVARACQSLPGMERKVAGIVHGVMPALGAAVAYRRCKVGMRDEDVGAGFAIGNDGKKVTAVFAQAPGALQLLPNSSYRRQWLSVEEAGGKSLNVQPVNSPYDDIYLRRDRWWGLVREEWLRPEGGVPLGWEQYVTNIEAAKSFHERLINSYHKNTYVYYGGGSGNPSFETVKWVVRDSTNAYMDPSKNRPSTTAVGRLGFSEVSDQGVGPIYIREVLTAEQSQGAYPRQPLIYWRIECAMQDGAGDGTVPLSSGRAPMGLGGDCIRQQFRLGGFAHEESYRNRDAQYVTLYALMKIAGEAEVL